MTQVRLTDETAAKLKELSWRESLRSGGRITQGDIIARALEALERALMKSEPPAPEDEIRPEVRAAAREAGLDV